MSALVSFYVKSISWNGSTYTNASGGPILVTVRHGSDPLEDRTGNDEYPPFVASVNKFVEATFTLRDLKFITALGVKSTLAALLQTKGADVSISVAGMVLITADMSQRRAEAGEVTVTLRHESADGITVPIS